MAALLVNLFLQIEAQKASYDRFVEKAIFEHGVKINLIGTSRFSRKKYGETIEVAINPDATLMSKNYVYSAYSFLGTLSGRTIKLTEQVGKFFESDIYVYITPLNVSPLKGSETFKENLVDSIRLAYSKSPSDELLSYINFILPIFYGTFFFFNSEFSDIDFDNVIKYRTAHKLANTQIDKSVVYINAPESQSFSNYVAIQEIFQEYNMAADVNDPEFRLKSILYDHDEILGTLTGPERIVELQKNAAMGLCPFDVMLAIQLQKSDGANPSPAWLAEFALLKARSYYYYWTTRSDLFDVRCW